MPRKIRSFEADADVDALLAEAQKNNIVLGHLVNEALRRFFKRGNTKRIPGKRGAK